MGSTFQMSSVRSYFIEHTLGLEIAHNSRKFRCETSYIYQKRSDRTSCTRKFHTSSEAHLNFSSQQDSSGLSREIVLIIDEVLQEEGQKLLLCFSLSPVPTH